MVTKSPLTFCSHPGIDVHYLHVKPKNPGAAFPLIMVHGWPGSFYEFYGLIPLLTEPSDPDGLVFEVVCPSIPGYAFSEAPHKKGTPAFSCRLAPKRHKVDSCRFHMLQLCLMQKRHGFTLQVYVCEQALTRFVRRGSSTS